MKTLLITCLALSMAACSSNPTGSNKLYSDGEIRVSKDNPRYGTLVYKENPRSHTTYKKIKISNGYFVTKEEYEKMKGPKASH